MSPTLNHIDFDHILIDPKSTGYIGCRPGVTSFTLHTSEATQGDMRPGKYKGFTRSKTTCGGDTRHAGWRGPIPVVGVWVYFLFFHGIIFRFFRFHQAFFQSSDFTRLFSQILQLQLSRFSRELEECR